MKSNRLQTVLKILSALAILVILGCARRSSQPVVVVEQPSPPEGAKQMCWEEPKVAIEKQGPGVDEQGHWYHPSYDAVREVKMGRWVPCSK
jgi:hypothetical protein